VNTRMNTSNPHRFTGQWAEATVELPTERAKRPARHAKERPKRFLAMYLRSHSIHAAVQEAQHLHQLERAGESAWTPWIAIAGLILFLAAVGLLMFGIVEGALHLLASASVEAEPYRVAGTGT
jgi:hypothetical protein